MKLNLYDVINSLELRLQGIKSLGFLQPPGWTEPVEFYLYKCKKHGLQIGYAMGHDLELRCKECLMESVQEDLNSKYPRVNDPKIPAQITLKS